MYTYISVLFSIGRSSENRSRDCEFIKKNRLLLRINDSRAVKKGSVRLPKEKCILRRNTLYILGEMEHAQRERRAR